MPKSELLNQILSDYIVSAPTTADAAGEFCEYAAGWLSRTPPVGVGHSVAGLTVRLSDGRELALFDAEEFPEPQSGPSVSITGGGGNRVRVGEPSVADRSLPITGQ